MQELGAWGPTHLSCAFNILGVSADEGRGLVGIIPTHDRFEIMFFDGLGALVLSILLGNYIFRLN